LPLRELFPIGGTADPRAVARSASAAERYVRLVGDGLVVDMQKSGVEAIADRDRAADVGREHAADSPYSLGWRATPLVSVEKDAIDATARTPLVERAHSRLHAVSTVGR